MNYVVTTIAVALVVAAGTVLARLHSRSQRKKAAAVESWQTYVVDAAMKALKGKTFAVIVRTAEGKKTKLETEVVNALVHSVGLEVVSLPTEVYNQIYAAGVYASLPEGVLAVIGTTWDRRHDLSPDTLRFLDFRVVNRKGIVYAAKCHCSEGRDDTELNWSLAYQAIETIVSAPAFKAA